MSQTVAESLVQGCSFLIEDPPIDAIHTSEEVSDDVRMMGQSIKKFIEQRVVPQAEAIDAMEPGLMLKLFREAGELGMLMTEVPEEYGGLGMDFFDAMYLVQTMAGSGAFGTASMAHVGIGTLPILFFGKPEIKERLLPDLATGAKMASYALTEPGSGSDAMAARCKAVLADDGEHYLITGNKQFITNGAWADVVTVFAKVDGDDDKFTAFVVEPPTDGFQVAPEEKKMGIRGSSTCALSFNNVKVSKENILGEIGDGGKIALNILNLGRLKLGIGAVGGARVAMKSAVQYGKERKQFKRPIVEFGLMQQKIAMMASGIYAGEAMTMRTAGHAADAIHAVPEAGAEAMLKVLEEFLIECAIEKVYQSELLDRVVDETVQMYGGYGFTTEYPAERYYRDARISRIYEGTNEINRLVIGGTLLKRAGQNRLALIPAVMATAGAVMEGKHEVPTFDGPLADMHERVWRAKRIVHVAAMAFMQGMGDKISNPAAVAEEQECLGAIADCVMEVYALETTTLRAQKTVDASGASAAALPIALTEYHADRACRVLVENAERVVNAILDADSIPLFQKAIDQLNPRRATNLRDLGRQIAAAVIENDGELVA